MNGSKSIGARVVRVMDAISHGMWVFSAGIVFFITTLVCVAVLLRYYFHLSVGWTTELSEYFIFLIVMFGAPWVLKKDQHVNVDVVVNLASPRVRRVFNLFTSIVGLLVCAAVFYYGSLAFHENFVKGTLMVKIMPVPKWMPILFIPIMAFFTGYQFLMKVISFARAASHPVDEAAYAKAISEKEGF